VKTRDPIYYRFVAGTTLVLLAIYCSAALFYVATSGDIGIRCLLTSELTGKPGIPIRQVDPVPEEKLGGLPDGFGVAPEVGDHVVEINDRPVHSFASFSQAMASLRQALSSNPGYDGRVEGANPVDIDRYASLPPVILYVSPRSDGGVERGATAEEKKAFQAKYVRIRFVDNDTGRTEESWLMLRPLPALEVVLSIVWCLLQFAIFALAALSFCNRPSDPAGRLFFILSLLTLPAFVGGYHWWLIASSPGLTFPFVYAAVLLPVVTLAFFLNYPTRSELINRHPVASRAALYTAPGLMLLVMTFFLTRAYVVQDSQTSIAVTQTLLVWLRWVVDIYIMVALVYFAFSVAVVFRRYRSCQQPAEQKQLQWILGAACLALPLVLYTVYLAYEDRVGMALGRGRIPMVIVSLLFLTAYAIGIVRYRLMLIDQIISRRVLYLALTQLLTVAYSLMIAVGSLLTVYRGMSVPEQIIPLAIILTLGILAAGWMRDRAQEALDRRFFREKYRLDRAMHQMNTVVARVADVRALAEHMLRSCREVLQVRFSALYLRDPRSAQFELVAVVNGQQLPSRIALDDQANRQLEQEGSCQRIGSSGRSQMPSLQMLHRDLNSQLIHGFEVDGRLSGLVVLGPKASSTPYTAEDTTFVTAIGQMTAVALQCVRVQQNVSRLDGMLQEKVKKIEAQERQLAILRQQLDSRSEPEPAADEESTLPASSFDRGKIRGSSPAIVSVLDSVRKVAPSETTVLIRGESGSGKELLAQAIHANSNRKDNSMVSVNCAALSPTLLESELFGHVKGAFTGAYRDSAGRFQMADKGTLFLDEIGDLPPDVQVKLLRVLQERKFEPVGSRESVSVDVRLIAATHQNLEERIRTGLFRQDLYYRLNVITLTLPPLRDRKEDILELSLEFLREAAGKSKKSIRDIDDLAYRALLNYDWPGNIRELHNAIHRAVVLAETDCLLLENLPKEVREAVSDDEQLSIYEASESRPRSKPRKAISVPARSLVVPADATGEDEIRQLKSALDSADGNKAQAARLLGMPRSTFYSKLKKYGI